MDYIDEDELASFNLSVLQRIDPEVSSLLCAGGHVAVYVLDPDTRKWSMRDVKGPLFLMKRKSIPKYVFVVLNRTRIRTLVEEITAQMQFEISGPYLLYQNAQKETFGLWFFNTAMRDLFFDTLQRLVAELALESDSSPSQQDDEDYATVSSTPININPNPNPNPNRPSSAQSELSPAVANLLLSAKLAQQQQQRPPHQAPHPHLMHLNQPHSQPSQLPQLPPQRGPEKINLADLFKGAAPTAAAAPTPTSPLAALLAQPHHHSLNRSGSPAPPPGLLSSPSARPSSSSTPLSKDQLKSTIQQLLENDTFLDAIYRAYSEALRQ